MPFYTDTHCHLDFPAFNADREEVINRAQAASLSLIINPGIDLPTSQIAILLSKTYPGFIFAAIGFHPNYGEAWLPDSLETLKSLAIQDSVLAIGEIGLDYYRHYTPREQQRLMFTEQLALAQELSLPVIIHNRDATFDLMTILEDWVSALPANSPLKLRPGVLHSFSADLQTALHAIKLHFYIGISGPITFRNAQDQKDLVAQLPLESILLETDAPYLTPHPYRGRRNEPAYVPFIATEIAHLHHCTPDELAQITYRNATRLFDLKLT